MVMTQHLQAGGILGLVGLAGRSTVTDRYIIRIDISIGKQISD